MNKIFTLLKYTIYFFILLTFIKASFSYTGSKFVYTLFSIISIFHLFFALRKDSYFVDKFVAIFIWLGFWFKFSFEFGYQLWGEINFREGIGLFDKSSESYDNVLILASIGIIAFIIASFLSKFIFSIHKVELISFKNLFFNKYKKYIYLVFIFIVVTVSSLNIKYGIYQKGLIPNEDISIFISYIFRWLLLFGFTSFACILIFFELNNKIIDHKYLFIVFLESFISNLSLMSRSVIFNYMSFIYGIFVYFKKINIKKYFFYFIIIFSFILFFINIFFVNELRNLKYYKNSSYNFEKIFNYNLNKSYKNDYLVANFSSLDIKNFNIFQIQNKLQNNIFQDIGYLLLNRWVGIDALMAVSAQESNLGFDLIKESLDEKFVENEYSLFEKKFLLRKNKEITNENLLKSNSIILPGLVAYLYFSGSKIFVCISIILLMFLCYLLERLIYLFSDKNLILTAFMGYIFASRLAHSGYLVSNNLNYLFAIIINLIAIYVVMLIFKKLNQYFINNCKS